MSEILRFGVFRPKAKRIIDRIKPDLDESNMALGQAHNLSRLWMRLMNGDVFSNIVLSRRERLKEVKV